MRGKNKGKNLFDVIGATKITAEAFAKTVKGNEWADVPALRGRSWKPKKIGDKLIGVIVGSRFSESTKFRNQDGTPKVQTVFDLRDDKGAIHSVFASGMLEQRLNVALHAFGEGRCMVEITFTGQRKIEGFKNKARDYVVRAKRVA